jgi:hypothetical protein
MYRPYWYIITLIPIIFCVYANAQTDPFGIIDTLQICSGIFMDDSNFVVPVILSNDELLMGLTIPIGVKGDSINLRCDSVIIQNNRIANCQYFSVDIDNQHKTILLGIVPSVDSNQIYFTQGQGVLCNLFFSVEHIQTTSYETLYFAQVHPFNRLKFIGPSITPFVPATIDGIITISRTDIDDDTSITTPTSLLIRPYPNPFNRYIYLDIFGNQTGEFVIKIYDLMGRIIFESRYSAIKGNMQIVPIDFYGNPSGIYFICVNSANQQTISKVLYLK